MTALDPGLPEMGAEAPSQKWIGERVAFITEQYLTYRKSAGEIARMLGPTFTRNAVTGKLFRTGALQARSGIGLGNKHGLPKGDSFCGRMSRSTPRTKKAEAEAISPPANNALSGPPQDEPGDADLVKKTEALFEIDGIALLDAKECHCRWPAKPVDGAAHVCGAPKVRGAYCENHAAIAYRSASPPAPEIRAPDQQTGPARGRSGTPFGEAS